MTWGGKIKKSNFYAIKFLLYTIHLIFFIEHGNTRQKKTKFENVKRKKMWQLQSHKDMRQPHVMITYQNIDEETIWFPRLEISCWPYCCCYNDNCSQKRNRKTAENKNHLWHVHKHITLNKVLRFVYNVLFYSEVETFSIIQNCFIVSNGLFLRSFVFTRLQKEEKQLQIAFPFHLLNKCWWR